MKKHRFTWIDGLVLAVIAVLIAGTCFKFFSNDSAANVTQETVDFSCQLEISGVRDFTCQALQEGDKVFDGTTGALLGTIRQIDITPGQKAYETTDGKMVNATTEGRFDVVLTLDCTGTVSGNTYKNGVYTFFVNQESMFHTKYSTWTATIISID